MFATTRIRIVAAALAVALTSGGIVAALTTSASASAGSAALAARVAHSKTTVNRFDLNGYVIDTAYTSGPNTGNTFQQTYTDSTVTAKGLVGPFTGASFGPDDYVALPIGHHQIYITWLVPGTFAIPDVFVMNFQTHIVYDYAPGSATPESIGTIKVTQRGTNRIP